MRKLSKSDVQVVGTRVLVKRPTGNDSYNWVCVANFTHQPGTLLEMSSEDANSMAQNFANSLCT